MNRKFCRMIKNSLLLGIISVMLCSCASRAEYLKDYQNVGREQATDLSVGGVKRLDSTSSNNVIILPDDSYPIGQITASNAFLINLDTSEVILSKQSLAPIAAGNFTKITTAYVTLQKCDPAATVVIGTEIYNVKSELSRCKFTKDDTVTVQDLLYGLITHCGNDAAIPLAINASGNMSQFIKDMNTAVEELDTTGNTSFSNAYGYPTNDTRHETTLYDTYVILNAALKDERFVQLISAKDYSCTYTGYNGLPAGVRFTNWLPYFSEEYFLPAGLALVGGMCEAAEYNPSQIFVVVTNPAGERFLALAAGCESYEDCYSQMQNILANIPAN